MNFIYDILVNFNEDLYDFYEWNYQDNVTHIRRIPLFKISSDVFKKIKDHNFRVDMSFLKKIENKTEKFTSRDVEKINYAMLLGDSNDVIAVKFDEKGNNIGLSKLLIDECEDVLDVVNRCDETNILFEILDKRNIHNFKTRLQIEKASYLIKSLKKLEQNKDIEKLNYLYFECFNEKQESLEEVINRLKHAINNDKLGKTMYDFFKLISIN